MFKDKLNKTELEILLSILKKPQMISQLADALGKDISWISRNVNHLQEFGFVSMKREGKSVFVSIVKNPLGDSFTTLISEEPMLKVEKILTGSGLKILPLLLNPGNRANGIVQRSSLSLRTVKGLISQWRKMGVVTLEKGVYVINERHKPLINFIKYYSYNTIIKHLKESYPDATIVWHWRDEFIFAIEHTIHDKRFISAATTRLYELNYDIVAGKEYYFHNPIMKTLSEEEALIQSYLLNPGNPRIPRLIIRAMNKGKIEKKPLLEFAKKYGLKKKIEEVISNAR
ncbi:MAG: helix-turn-helix transcriptional regulator [Thermoplasmata archaeon]|nr:MAG: helix-turn-helix transcriptional regulator [Thermoplasmata archaeon]